MARLPEKPYLSSTSNSEAQKQPSDVTSESYFEAAFAAAESFLVQESEHLAQIYTLFSSVYLEFLSSILC